MSYTAFMRRGVWHRAGAALVAVWLALSMAELPALDACPVHGAGHALSAATAGVSHAHHHGTSQRENQHRCSCTGNCCVACGSVALPSQGGVESPAIVGAAEVAGWSGATSPIARSPHRLPPAIGPPSGALTA